MFTGRKTRKRSAVDIEEVILTTIKNLNENFDKTVAERDTILLSYVFNDKTEEIIIKTFDINLRKLCLMLKRRKTNNFVRYVQNIYICKLI